MKKIAALIIILIDLTAFLNAQVTDNYVITPNDLKIQSSGEYDILEIIDHSFSNEIGNPQLPVKIISFVLPYSSTVTGIEVSVIQEKIEGSYYIFPVQPPRPLDGSAAPAFVEPNQAVYNSSAPYPNKIVEIINDGYTHGYHVVTVAIYPVEYHPVSREIYLRNISFTINYNNSFDKRLGVAFERQTIRGAELGKQFVQNLVKNVQDVKNSRNQSAQIIDYTYSKSNVDTTRGGSTSAIDVLVPDYIIITNNALKSTFQQLADWKTKKGVPAIIKTVEEIDPNYQGSDLQEKIRNYLKDIYINYGHSKFVLLGGDVNIVPARLFSNTSYATDMYYATVVGTWNANNNDKFGEGSDATDYNYAFFLGRAPVKDIAQADVFENKSYSCAFYSIFFTIKPILV